MLGNWKQLLLKSGLPLEYEVQECFVKRGCIVWGERTYLKEDEAGLIKEFSYDIDANYWKGGYCVDFMIECKYKVENAKWFFLPHPYKYQSELDKNDFLHPVDHFSKYSFVYNKFPYSEVFPRQLGDFCTKGVEIYQNQYLEKNIRKAIKQLSYAFVDRIIDCFENQLTVETFKNTIFLIIPIIVTNADLYLVNEDISISQIEKSDSIKEISSKRDFLLYHNKIGEDLRTYSMARLESFFSNLDEKWIRDRLSSFTEDLNHLVRVIASEYCPQVVVVMQHTRNRKNYDVLFNYLNEILEPSEQTTKKLKTAVEDIDKKYTGFFEKIRRIRRD